MKEYIKPVATYDVDETPTPYVCSALVVGLAVYAVLVYEGAIAVNLLLAAFAAEGVVAFGNYLGIGGGCNV